ncbi:hypothetical protein [Myxosarcina sp. GI1]|uniref:hypothetical protein n=1 Tax=Myxosarcina sp. GI1 TaxID=1541065 RepID=UPI00056441FB|nr:hypothetical protein [Myxosarcina sp. GI1]
MNKKLLSILGCSGSVALTMIGTNAAEANTGREYVFKAPEVASEATIPKSDTDYPFYDCSCDSYDPATIEAVDREGDKAIELYGCDCAGCRNLVRNLDKTPKSLGQI